MITKKHFNLICMKFVLLFQEDSVFEKSFQTAFKDSKQNNDISYFHELYFHVDIDLIIFLPSTCFYQHQQDAICDELHGLHWCNKLVWDKWLSSTTLKTTTMLLHCEQHESTAVKALPRLHPILFTGRMQGFQSSDPSNRSPLQKDGWHTKKAVNYLCPIPLPVATSGLGWILTPLTSNSPKQTANQLALISPTVASREHVTVRCYPLCFMLGSLAGMK